ncbi:iron complex transport system substrate-binding protein [Kineothrix alysoides]|uniref:Iron complex transport system substrate-binding protein n=1 Tax=Kineothrix alysoides TaxID=1469948 RepID=A0A4R1QYG2_9FIRM|nr:ABC transporter substrate-binding protein [Kineothrix alysoides]TCL57480.1 iron complex transport system substrate-binding protein [Kineothrix alysoides]
MKVKLAMLFLCTCLFAGCGTAGVLQEAEQSAVDRSDEIGETDMAGGVDATDKTDTVAEPAEGEQAKAQTGAILEFTDALGVNVTVENTQRTAVLSGSYADAWLLAGGSLFAVTEDAKGVIEVSDNMIMLGDLKNPSIETLIAEDVDFIILSATIEEHVNLRDTLEKAGITTAYFEVETFEDYADMMKIMTDITGRKDLYKTNVEDVRLEIEEQLERVDGSSPTVLFLRAYSTGVKAKGSDSMTGQMLKDLGCVNIADSEDGLLEDLSMEAIIDAEPDYIFVTTMGESKEAAMDMVEELLVSNPAWSGLKAVKNDHYYVLPKELFHIKPNERWGESYRILADYLYEKK